METQDIYSAFRSLENPSVPLDPFLEESENNRAMPVTDRTSKTFAPWWQGINVLASGVAQLPLITYRRLQPKGKERANDHPTYSVLHRRPNDELGPFAFKELMTMQCVSRGNAYAWIDKRGGRVRGLWPFPIGSVIPVRANGDLRYVYTPTEGGQEILQPDRVFHLKGPADDGLEGLSVVGLARESLSGGMQAQRYATKFFSNDAKPGLVLEFPDAIDGPTAQNVLKHWNQRHGGSSNANKPALLDRGGKVSGFSMSNTDAQFLESRQFSRSEVASWLNIPPHMVGDLTRSTFSNIEQQSIDFVVYSLMPWLIRWTDECNAKLFTTREINSDELYCEFLVDALLRGDYNSRMDGHTKALRMGLFSIDELRDMENRNPLPDSLGESHYITLDMAPVGQLPSPDGTTEPPVEEDNDAARQVFALFLSKELTRCYRAIGNNATRQSGTPGKLQVWLDNTLSKECDTLREQLEGAEDVAKKAGIDEWRCEEYVETVWRDFRALIARELDGDASTLKARMKGKALRLSADRPSEIVSTLWS